MGKDEIVEKNKIDMKEKKSKNFFSKGIDAFVLSMISFFLIPLWYLSLIASVYSIIRACRVIKETGSNFAKAGLIFSIISINLLLLTYTQIIAYIIHNFSPY